MYRLFCLFSALILAFCVPAYAAENGEEVADIPALFEEELPPDVDFYVPAADTQETSDTVVEREYVPFILTSTAPENSDLGSEVVSTLPSGAVPPNDPADGTMKAVVQSIFGAYEPVQQSVTAYLADGTSVDGQEIVDGISGVDWAYISGVALFGIALSAFFKTLRVVINGGRC